MVASFFKNSVTAIFNQEMLPGKETEHAAQRTPKVFVRLFLLFRFLPAHLLTVHLTLWFLSARLLIFDLVCANHF